MKKFIASFILLGLFLVSFVTLASPAQASIPKSISYCQATGSESNPYVHIPNAPLTALIDKDGNFKQGGINAGDKVPPFSWDFGGDDTGSFPGQNWDATLDPNFVDVRKCDPSTIPLPVPTVDFTDATCILNTGSATVTNTDARVTVSGPELVGKVWNATFTLPVNTTYETYTWADGKTGNKTFSQTLTDPTTDDLWDTRTNSCRTPDTGGGISNFALMVGGGALGLGMMFLGATNFIGRRRNA